ncbi:MAG: alpha/beta hydrolase [Myxococcota bacterium]
MTWQSRGERVPVAASPSAEPRRLFVVQEGQGPDLLLLHGFPTSSWDWVQVLPGLAARFRCLAPDFLGFGFSDKPHPHAYSILEQADLVETLLVDRGIHELHVLAHDYGDTVAQELVARDLERPHGERRLRSVCFLNGGLFPETHRMRPVQRLLRTPLGPMMARWFAKTSFYRSFPRVFSPTARPSPAQLDAFWSTIAAHEGPRVFPSLIGYIAERRRHRTRWVEAILEPPMPVQIINGSLDPVSGAHMVQRFLELGGLAAIDELADVGHYPQVEVPDRVLSAFFGWHDAIAAGM